MKQLLENWNKFINEEKETIMFPARFLKSHMGEYRTEKKWRDFLKLGDEEKREWAKTVDTKSNPVEVTVFMDGVFGFGDGHHRVMAGKVLDIDIPIIITYNHIKNKAQPGTWEAWWKEVSKGNSPAQLNPEGYNLRSPEQVKELVEEQ